MVMLLGAAWLPLFHGRVFSVIAPHLWNALPGEVHSIIHLQEVFVNVPLCPGIYCLGNTFPDNPDITV